MGQFLSSAVLVVTSAALNVGGVALLKHAMATGSATAAVAGALAWAATSMVFLELLRAEQSLAVVAAITSAAGYLAVVAIGVAVYNEVPTLRQVIGMGALIVGMALLSLPRA